MLLALISLVSYAVIERSARTWLRALLVPRRAPVLTAALYERFSSRGEADFADKLLSAMRFEFGGHLEKAAK